MNTRDLGPCCYCGQRAQERHHFTASLTGSADYLDAAATIALCVACHKAEHAAWRVVGLDAFDDPLLARMCRIAWTLGRLAAVDQLPGPVLQPMHAVLVGIRDDVAELVQRSHS